MAIAAALPAWIDDVVDDLEAEFGSGTAQRGRTYADEGRVLQIVADRPGEVLLATVLGSGRARYQTLIRAERPRGELLWEARCSCPVGVDCKHAVAVLVAAARQRGADVEPARRGMRIADRQTPAWERLLEPLAAPPVTAAPTVEAGLMLVWSSKGPLPAAGEQIELRPVRRGASGRWIKADLTWSAIRYGRRLPEPMTQALSAIATAAEAANRNRYQYGETRATLGSLGSGGVALLGEVVRAGVTLLTSDQRRRVVVADAPAAARVDVRREADGSVRLEPSWQVDGADWAVRGARALGSPPNVLLASRGSDLLVASIAPLGREVLPLMASAQAVVVPPADAERFLTTYHPLLRRRIDVVSSDGSCPPPPLVAPRLRLEATYEDGHRLGLCWAVAYGEGTGAPTFPVSGAVPPVPPGAPTVAASRGPDARLAQALRQEDRETALVEAAVAMIQPHVPGAIAPPGFGGRLQPRSPASLVGMDTAVFTAEVMPLLRAHDDIEVIVVGEPADYRHVEQPPVVRLGVSQSADETDWFDLDVRVELAGEDVPFRPLFTALACGEDHLLLDSGAWFGLDRPELAQLRQLIEEARALSDREGPLRLSRWQAGLWDELAELGVVEAQCSAWTEAVGGLLDPAGLAGLRAVAVPEELEATLRPYQLDGFRWLSYLWQHRLGGILADDMGLGKTVQALAAILHARDRRLAADESSDRAPDPVLVVAPTSVVGTWVGEAAKFAPDLRVAAVTETAARRGVDLDTVRADVDVVVTTYALVRIEAEDYTARPWAAVLLDEAQFVKNPRGRTHQVVRALTAPVKVAMTGTPLENSLMDLWALLAITAPGLFPKPEVFTELYRRPIESGSDPLALARLQRRLRPLMLRRTKELVAPELPPKQEQVVRVELAPAHRRIYDRHLQRERQRVLGMLANFEKNRFAIFRSLMVLRQLALAPALVDPDGAGARVPATKIEAFAEQIAEVAAEGHRALVFSQFTGFLGLIRERLDRDGIGYAYLDGATRDRRATIENWRGSDAPVFLISLKAGGFGLTLTEADYVFVLDPWWNPAAEAQAVDRTHRIGQDKTVMVYRYIAQDTIEEKVLALQDRKRDLFARVVDGGGAVDGLLTADDIRGLLEV